MLSWLRLKVRQSYGRWRCRDTRQSEIWQTPNWVPLGEWRARQRRWMRSKAQLSNRRETTASMTLITLHAAWVKIYTPKPVKRGMDCAELITSRQTQPSAHLPPLSLPQAHNTTKVNWLPYNPYLSITLQTGSYNMFIWESMEQQYPRTKCGRISAQHFAL